MGLEICCPLERSLGRRMADLAGAAVGEVADQGDARHHLAILGKMALKCRMQSVMPEPPLKLRAPSDEPLVGFRRESQVGIAHLIASWPEVPLGADGPPIQRFKHLKDPKSAITSLTVGLTVHIHPTRRYIGPNQEAEAL